MRLGGVVGWDLWSLPRRALAFVLAVQVAGVVALAAAVAAYPPTLADLGGPGWLLLCAGAAVEGAHWIDHLRQRHSDTPTKNVYVVWMVAAALALPPGAAAAFAAGLQVWIWVRVMGMRPSNRSAFSAAAALLAVVAAGQVYRLVAVPSAWHGELVRRPLAPAGGLLAGAVLVALDVGLPAVAVLLTDPAAGAARAAGGSLRDQGVEVASACLGVLLACGYAVSPWLALLALPVVLGLQRTVALTQLQAEARTDAKTGLPNARWWHEIARRELERARRLGEPVTVLIADLDHFKQVNDAYGHLAGDAVLRRVAREFAAQVREYDVVGRFGGEEFVVVLPSTGTRTGAAIAERLRLRVRGLATPVEDTLGDHRVVLGPTVSIGVATFPTHGQHLPDLLRAADAALYSAKAAGRDTVRTRDQS